jgi:hypothetical protein
MKKRFILSAAVIAIIAAVCLFTACRIDDPSPWTEWSPGNYTLLSPNTWADGALNMQKNEQWFKFTATADNQYFHFKAGTIDGSVYFEPYDKKGSKLAPEKMLYDNQKTSFVVSKWEPHFIKVTPVLKATTGTFKIAFNTFESPPSLE